MSKHEKPEILILTEQLPCGCRMGNAEINGVPTFLYEPCSLDCTYYKYVQTESALQGVNLDYRYQR